MTKRGDPNVGSSFLQPSPKRLGKLRRRLDLGAVLILANWPYTHFGIMPTNTKINAIAEDQAGAASRALITTWSRLHAVRTALGIAATVAFLWALS